MLLRAPPSTGNVWNNYRLCYHNLDGPKWIKTMLHIAFYMDAYKQNSIFTVLLTNSSRVPMWNSFQYRNIFRNVFRPIINQMWIKSMCYWLIFVTDSMLNSIQSCHPEHAWSQLAGYEVNNNSHVAECIMQIWYSYVTTFCVTLYTLLQRCELMVIFLWIYFYCSQKFIVMAFQHTTKHIYLIQFYKILQKLLNSLDNKHHNHKN
jgi:hypothetical protein